MAAMLGVAEAAMKWGRACRCSRVRPAPCAKRYRFQTGWGP